MVYKSQLRPGLPELCNRCRGVVLLRLLLDVAGRGETISLFRYFIQNSERVAPTHFHPSRRSNMPGEVTKHGVSVPPLFPLWVLLTVTNSVLFVHSGNRHSFVNPVFKVATRSK
jgi:hypothetical protein